MNARMSKSAVGVLAGTVWATSLSFGAGPVKLSGSIAGLVADGAGVPQMGATVILYNRSERVVRKILTSDRGTFGFDSLSPDVYTIRVTLASFLPALKRNILVQPGMQSLLNVNLATVFSSIQLIGIMPGNSPIMSEDWKWVLRSASATRPVLRMLPELAGVPRIERKEAVFSDTRGLVRLSAGDQGGASVLGNEPDLGTAFALATSFLGKNQLQVSGNIGYSQYSGVPSAGFRTSFRRELPGGAAPEVKVTMRQLYLPARAGSAVLGGMADGSPVLRTLSATMMDQTRLSDNVRFEYGFSMDSVTFLDRLNYFSPYGRLTYDRGKGEAIQVSYAAGTPPAELFTDGESGVELQQDVAALALFPRVSLKSGRARVQRSQSWEVGYHKKVGSKTYSVAAYSEQVANAAVTMTGADGMASPDLLPDLFADTWTYNAGNFRSLGYVAAVTQDLGENFDATVAYGTGNALTAGPAVAEAETAEEFRHSLRSSRRHSVTAKVSGRIAQSGTQFAASYQWANLAALTPAHLYMMERVREGIGLNVRVRQPVPYFGGLPGHLEATADLRNLLAQGYVPLMEGQRRMVLMHTPRSVRGGLSISF